VAALERAPQTVASSVGLASDKELGAWVLAALDGRVAKTIVL